MARRREEGSAGDRVRHRAPEGMGSNLRGVLRALSRREDRSFRGQHLDAALCAAAHRLQAGPLYRRRDHRALGQCRAVPAGQCAGRSLGAAELRAHAGICPHAGQHHRRDAHPVLVHVLQYRTGEEDRAAEDLGRAGRQQALRQQEADGRQPPERLGALSLGHEWRRLGQGLRQEAVREPASATAQGKP